MQVAQHASCLSGDYYGLAEDGGAEDEGWPDVSPDPEAGGLTGVVPHVHLSTELSLLVLNTEGRGLEYCRNYRYFGCSMLNIFTWDNKLQALFTHFRMNICSCEHCLIEG